MIAETRILSKFLSILALLLTFLGFQGVASAEVSEEVKTTEYNFTEAMNHHISDNYNWDFGMLGHLELPRILYTSTTGLKFYPSTTAAIADGWVEAHHLDEEAVHGALLAPSAKVLIEDIEAGQHNSTKKSEEEMDIIKTHKPLDLSITRNVLYLFFAFFILVFVFSAVAKGYSKNKGKAPKGIQSFFEPIVVYIRDEVAIPNLGHKNYARYMPLLLTLFFFIWFLDMMGLTPFSANVTGNIAVTLSLSLFSLVAILASSNKHFWAHTLNPPGVPLAVKFILVPVELLGIIIKPIALTIRLFANISAGHIMIIGLFSLIFIFGESGKQAMLGHSIGIFSTLFVLCISLLELFVAILQAFVFTLLTAVFIGQAIEEPEHHH